MRTEEECYRPLFDTPYIEAMNQWIIEHELWEKGEHPDQKNGECGEYRYYAQWARNPPDVEYYRPDWKPEEMTWFQVYETVSEGTPVTPPFATREELVDYLVTNGDYWDQYRDAEVPWSRKQAEAFVFGGGSAPSLIIENGIVKTGVEALG